MASILEMLKIDEFCRCSAQRLISLELAHRSSKSDNTNISAELGRNCMGSKKIFEN